jgi:putative oxidoreductase
MTPSAPTRAELQAADAPHPQPGRRWERGAVLYARFALGAAFLSGVADRFGWWSGRNVGYGDFAHFVEYTAKVNSFMPSFTIPFLAWAATLAELSLGLALLFGAWLRWVALGSAALLVLFGVAMAISFGLKSPLDYSVFSASAGALLLAAAAAPRALGRARNRTRETP